MESEDNTCSKEDMELLEDAFRLEICSKSTPKFSTTDPRISGMVARKLITVNDKGYCLTEWGRFMYCSNC